MSEIEKLRGLLTRCDEYLAEKGVIRDAKLRREIRAALSQPAKREAFVREDRYLVIKYADLNKVPAEYRLPFLEYLDDVNAELPHREFVVVESDWPEYELVWRMIEARVTGALHPIAQTEQRGETK